MQHKFEGPFKGFAVNLCQRSFWRVSQIMEMEDLLQEAYIVFHKCSLRYDYVEDAPQFMALYKRALTNHITDLSLKNSRARDEHGSALQNEDGELVQREHIGELDNDGPLRVMIRQAPHEIKMVLTLMLNAPAEITEALLASWSGTDRRKRGNGSERINRALGLPPEQDTMGMVRDYFR